MTSSTEEVDECLLNVYGKENGFQPDALKTIVKHLNLDNDLAKALVFSSLNSKDDNEIKQLLSKAVKNDFEKVIASPPKSKSVSIYQNLDPTQQRLLENSFPFFKFIFIPTDNNSHGFAAAHRKVEFEVLLQKISYSKEKDYTSFLKDNDYDAYFVDIGSNYPSIFKNKHEFVHCCSPVLNNSDANRFVNRYNNIFTELANNRFVSERQINFSKQINQILKGEIKYTKFLCMMKAQDCPVSAPYGLALHSTYDMNLLDLSRIMIKKNMRTLVGSFIYVDRILLFDSGKIDGIDVFWKIDRDERKIMFNFRNDSSMPYVHSLDNYLKLILTPIFYSESKKEVFYIELLENINGIQFFKINRRLRPVESSEKIYHQIAIPYLDNKYKIKFYIKNKDYLSSYFKNFSNIFDDVYHKDGNKFQLSTTTELFTQEYKVMLEASQIKYIKHRDSKIEIEFYYETELVDALLSFALGCTETKFKPLEVFAYARSYSAKIFVGKTVLHRYESVQAVKLYNLAHAVYLYVYDLKYNQGKVMQDLISEIEWNRNLEKKNIIGKLFTKRGASITNGDGKVPQSIFDRFDSWLFEKKKSRISTSTFITRADSYISRNFTVPYSDSTTANLELSVPKSIIELFPDNVISAFVNDGNGIITDLCSNKNIRNSEDFDYIDYHNSRIKKRVPVVKRHNISSIIDYDYFMNMLLCTKKNKLVAFDFKELMNADELMKFLCYFINYYSYSSLYVRNDVTYLIFLRRFFALTTTSVCPKLQLNNRIIKLRRFLNKLLLDTTVTKLSFETEIDYYVLYNDMKDVSELEHYTYRYQNSYSTCSLPLQELRMINDQYNRLVKKGTMIAEILFPFLPFDSREIAILDNLYVEMKGLHKLDNVLVCSARPRPIVEYLVDKEFTKTKFIPLGENFKYDESIQSRDLSDSVQKFSISSDRKREALKNSIANYRFSFYYLELLDTSNEGVMNFFQIFNIYKHTMTLGSSITIRIVLGDDCRALMSLLFFFYLKFEKLVLFPSKYDNLMNSEVTFYFSGLRSLNFDDKFYYIDNVRINDFVDSPLFEKFFFVVSTKLVNIVNYRCTILQQSCEQYSKLVIDTLSSNLKNSMNTALAQFKQSMFTTKNLKKNYSHLLSDSEITVDTESTDLPITTDDEFYTLSDSVSNTSLPESEPTVLKVIPFVYDVKKFYLCMLSADVACVDMVTGTLHRHQSFVENLRESRPLNTNSILRVSNIIFYVVREYFYDTITDCDLMIAVRSVRRFLMENHIVDIEFVNCTADSNSVNWTNLLTRIDEEFKDSKVLVSYSNIVTTTCPSVDVVTTIPDASIVLEEPCISGIQEGVLMVHETAKVIVDSEISEIEEPEEHKHIDNNDNGASNKELPSVGVVANNTQLKFEESKQLLEKNLPSEGIVDTDLITITPDEVNSLITAQTFRTVEGDNVTEYHLRVRINQEYHDFVTHDRQYYRGLGLMYRTLNTRGDGKCLFYALTRGCVNVASLCKFMLSHAGNDSELIDELTNYFGGILTMKLYSKLFLTNIYVYDCNNMQTYFIGSDQYTKVVEIQYHNFHYTSLVRVCDECVNVPYSLGYVDYTVDQYVNLDFSKFYDKCIMCLPDFDDKKFLVLPASFNDGIRFFLHDTLNDSELKINLPMFVIVTPRSYKDERTLNIYFTPTERFLSDNTVEYSANRLDIRTEVGNDLVISNLQNIITIISNYINAYQKVNYYVPNGLDITPIILYKNFGGFPYEVLEYGTLETSPDSVLVFPQDSSYNIMRNSMHEIRNIWRITESKIRENLHTTFEEIMMRIERKNVRNFTVDTSIGIVDLVRRRLIWKPLTDHSETGYVYLPYSKSFKKVELSFFDEKNLNNRYKLATQDPYAIFSKSTKVLNEQELYHVVEKVYVQPKLLNFDIKFVEGVPGAGKTTYIVDQLDKSLDLKQVILTATNESARDLRRRFIDKYYPNLSSKATAHVMADLMLKIKNMDSALITVKNYKVVEVLFVDEALMRHIGQIYWLAYLMKVKQLIICGDSCQIPYFNNEGIKTRFALRKIIHDNDDVTYLNTSYRIPRDSAAFLNSLNVYSTHIVTTSSIDRSLNIVNIKTINDVPNLEDTTYLTFSRAEKAELLQTLRFLSNSNLFTVGEYQGKQASNIALIRINEKVNPLFESLNQHIVALSRHTKTFTYYTIIEDTLSKNMNKILQYSTLQLRDFSAESKKGGGESYRNYIRNLEINKTNRYFPRLVQNRQLPDFETVLKPDFAVNMNFQNPTVVALVSNHGYSGYVANKFMFKELLYEAYEEEEIVVPPMSVSDPITIVQSVLDIVYPGSTCMDSRYDCDIFNVDPLIINCENLAFPDYFPIYTRKDTLTPSLRTSCPAYFNPTVKNILKAFNERNGSVPQLAGKADDHYMALKLFDNFKRTFIADTEIFDTFENNKISVNTDTLHEWLFTQSTDVLEKIKSDSSYSIYDKYLDEYNYILKRLAKPSLDPNPHLKFGSPQAIAHQDKMINAIFCPIAKELKQRLFSVLKKNTVLNCDMSPEDFTRLLNHRLPPYKFAEYSRRLEFDITKYDKSQGLLTLLFECQFMEKFGVPKDLIATWIYMHVSTKLYSITTKVSARVQYQRKSGDAMTFFGNTIYLMAVIAYVMELEGSFAMFSGDDSYILTNRNFDNAEIVNMMASAFNFEVKLFEFNYPYFCSKFLIPISDRSWIVVPDLIKLAIKLGRSDLVSFEHAEQYRISLVDLLKPLANYVNYDSILPALHDRYKTTDIPIVFINAIYFLITRPESFMSLYYLHPSDILSTYSTLPTLDI